MFDLEYGFLIREKIKDKSLAEQIAMILADVYAGKTHGNYTAELLFDRGGETAIEEIIKLLKENGVELV